MKEDKNIDGYKVDNLIHRLRFKQPEYDISSNYELLLNRINIPIISRRPNISSAWKWFSIAASIALIIVSTLHFVDLSRPKLTWYEVTAIPDAKTKIILPDSSTVWLNANANLIYPRSFEEAQREVSISGEAFFKVQKDKAHPFIVNVGKLQVKVLGTSFNIRTNSSNGKVVISLLEGKVALYEKGKSPESANVLMPDQEAIYSPSSGKIDISPICMDNVMSWMTGKFNFENNTLTEIGEELERAFHVKIHIENETMRQKTFNAKFENEETLDEILSILQISAKYKMEKRRGEIYIY